MFKNIAKFNDTSHYLPLFNGVLITDLFVILLSNMKNCLLGHKKFVTNLIITIFVSQSIYN